MSASQYNGILNGGALPEPPLALQDGPLRGVDDDLRAAGHNDMALEDLSHDEDWDALPDDDDDDIDDDDIGAVVEVPAPPAPVVPAPPAPPAALVAHPVFDVDIRRDGRCQFRHDTQRFFIAAHCRHPAHGPNCRANRQYRAHPRAPRVSPWQGRPGGTLLAWLKCADEFPDAASHQAILKRDQCVISPHLTQYKRSKWRAWCERKCPEFANFLREHEREPWPGEGVEPELPC